MEKVKLFFMNAWAWILTHKTVSAIIATAVAGVVVGLIIGC